MLAKDDFFITPNFKRSEFDCHDGTIVPVEYLPNLKKLCENLEVLREYMGHQPIHVNSGFRTYEHNKKEGSSPKSQHLIANAGDIWVKDIKPTELASLIEMLIFEEKMSQGGLGIYETFVHYDRRGKKARWNMT